jgi:hypothetical protein
MRTKFNLKLVSIKTFDDEYGTWSKYTDTMIITQDGNEDTYVGDSRIFEEYTSLIEEWNDECTKYPTFKFEKPIIEFKFLTCVENQEDVEHLKRLMHIEGEGKYVKSIYQRVQHYGGSEEGGWYYHTKHLVSGNDCEIGTDRYGEGYVEEHEFYAGQHEDTDKKFYC